jgi:transcriptional regulator with XRE-family HTH domain
MVFFIKLAIFGKLSRLRQLPLAAYCVSLIVAQSSLTLPLMSSSQLTNYLRTNRKRLVLSQEEVAFMLGFKGEDKGIKVCRDEKFAREPSLQMALAYEAIYGRPVRELFAGLYEQIEQEVAERAKILTYRIDRKPNPKRHQALANLVSKTIA